MNYLIIIPAYNEERHISTLLKSLSAIAKDIVVVDDGSEDATYQVVKNAGIPVIHQNHQGKGAALKTGFGYAIEKNYEWVITMDGDGQHDPQDVHKFVDAISNAGNDIIIGSRMDNIKTMPIVRKITNRFLSSLISRLIDNHIADTQCGFRAINSRVLKNIILETSHYDTESELIIKAGRAGYKIKSIPIKTIYNDSQSHINKFLDTVRFIRLVYNTL